MDAIEIHKKVRAPKDGVTAFFWDIAGWTRIWEPVTRTTVLFDDGRSQEFLMELCWPSGNITIRTFRFRDHEGNIEFFSPNPPGEMDRHRGQWRFETDGRSCQITARREYRLRKLLAESAQDFAVRSAKFKEGFEGRVTRLLEKVGGHLEGMEWNQNRSESSRQAGVP